MQIKFYLKYEGTIFFINELNVALLLVYGIRFSTKPDKKLNALLCYT